jgi:hypothetical protein
MTMRPSGLRHGTNTNLESKKNEVGAPGTSFFSVSYKTALVGSISLLKLLMIEARKRMLLSLGLTGKE